MNTKPLRSGFLVPFLLLCACFFDFPRLLGLTASLVKIRALLKLVSKTPKLTQKRCVHTIGAGVNLKALCNSIRIPN